LIYIDSNVFIYASLHAGREGDWCRDLLRRIAQGREAGLTSALTVDEVVYQVREDRGMEASVEAGRGLLEMAHLTVAPADTEVLWRTLDLTVQTRLYPRDAIHAATALLRNTEDFYSEDADFDAVDGLHRRWMR
jgi:predicted nucleic acid-binding protein